MKTPKFTAALEVLEFRTDKVLSRRVIGTNYDTHDAASAAAWVERQPGETVCIGVPAEYWNDEDEDMSAREMAEIEVDWLDITGDL